MAPFLALVVRVPRALEDLFVGGLAWCAQGVRQLDADPETSELWVYLHGGGLADAEAALAAARALLARNGCDPAGCGLRIERVEDERWVERYQASLRPFDLGASFRIYPSGHADGATGGRRPLLLVPGRAFGTGEHPTTRLCAETLERRVEPGEAWVDVGCGTAILSIVARWSGAARVLALDDDPEALEVARDVLAANGVDGVELRRGSAGDAPPGVWDGVVVNISAAFLLEQAAAVAALPAAGRTIVASGCMAADLDAVAAALAAVGCAVESRAEQAPWGLLVARRRG